jgi:hypothetical protein
MSINKYINPNPIIIECSARDSLQKSQGKQNSEWENNTSYPINLNPGDQVILKNVFIDTGGADINITEPLTISGLFGYYDVNYTWTDQKTGHNGFNAQADYSYYLAWNNNTESGTLQSLVCDFAEPLSCGFLDVIIQVSFIYDTLTQKGLQWKMNKGKRLTCQNRPYTVNLADWGGEIQDVIIGSVRNIDPGDPNAVYVNNSLVYTNVDDSLALLTNTFSCIVPVGSYTRDQLAKVITDQLASVNEFIDSDSIVSTNPFLFRTDDVKWEDQRLRFYKTGDHPDDPENAPYYVYENGDDMTSFWMGASQVSLIWDPDANHYSFDFMHTPLAYNNNIGMSIYESNNKYSTVLHQCGIYLLDLQPRDFWTNVLNFNMDNTLVKFDIRTGEPTETISDDELRSKITKALFTSQSLFPNFNRNISNQQYPLNISTDETVQLKGQNISAITDTFYLVEINLGNETFSYRGGINNEIRAIVGSYYQESNWVAGYSSDAIIYEHTGSPQTISRLRIRILDPNTKEPITTLGDNSFVYVQIVPSGGAE